MFNFQLFQFSIMVHKCSTHVECDPQHSSMFIRRSQCWCNFCFIYSERQRHVLQKI